MMLFKNGSGIIDSAFEQFQGIVEKLKEGTSKISTEIIDKEEEIASLTKEKAELSSKKTKAEVFKTNLEKMMKDALCTDGSSAISTEKQS